MDLRGTMKRLMGHWVVHAFREVYKNKHRNEGLAPSLVDIRRGTIACGAAGTVTELEKEEPPEETDLILQDDDDDAEDPVSTGTVVAEAVVPFSTVAAHVERAERLLYLR